MLTGATDDPRLNWYLSYGARIAVRDGMQHRLSVGVSFRP